MRFKNKVVLVTGATRGIGHAIAELFVKEEAIVIGTATTIEGATKIEQALSSLGHIHGIALDVTCASACAKVMAEITEKWGSPEILVNNAGITRDNLFLRMTEAEWFDVMNTHLNALYYLCKLAVKPMLKARMGRIINISSVVAATGNPGQTNYVAAKAGVVGFSKALALELASRHITVNVVAPGFIGTEMTSKLTQAQQEAILSQIPQGHMGTAEDIAQAVLFLASKEAAYITGQTLHVNGGMYCSS